VTGIGWLQTYTAVCAAAGLAHHTVTKYLRRVGNESEVPGVKYWEVSVELGKVNLFGRTIASFSRFRIYRYHSPVSFACHGCGLLPS
jgi:hypothetical protein